LSQGFGPARYQTKPLVSYQTYRQLSGWDFHPLAIRAVGAHTTFPLWSSKKRIPLFKHAGELTHHALSRRLACVPWSCLS
ncbi:MAG: hypothetical protein ABSF14_24495, partial [Terriglobia bacterium]